MSETEAESVEEEHPSKTEKKPKKNGRRKKTEHLPTPEELLERERLQRNFKNIETVHRHIRIVQDACLKLATRLCEEGEEDFARHLIANSLIHDNSKFHGIEWECLTTQEEDRTKLQLAHRQHVTTNPHHPEYWGPDITQMPRLYVAEMVCDWKARSDEFGSDLRTYIVDEAYPRFKIAPTGKVSKWIKYFLDRLLEKPFSLIKG